ncbi:MAG: GGDEF domain-containing protein [Burkholderiales bacterium]|nr:GGDEF domain-containing protein [Burkholderiales bacterium]
MRLRRWGLGVWMLLAALWAPLAAMAQAAPDARFPVLELSARAAPRIEVGAGMGVLVDPSGTLTIAQVRGTDQSWQAIDRQSPNFGFTSDAYWFRFRVHNSDTQALPRFIELPIPFLDDVQLYHFVNGALQVRYALGDELPFAQRVVQHRNFIMPVQLAVGDNDIYMRLASAGTIEAPLRIWDPVQFHAASNDENLAQGAVIGVLLVMIVYNLFVFFSTRDINYIYYIGFVGSYLLFHLTLTGYTYAYVWPQAVRWNSFAISTFVASSLLFTCLFTLSFLRLRRFSAPAFHLVRGLAVFSALLFVTTFVLPYSWTIRVGAAITLPTAAMALFLGYWRWWRGAKFARFYCLAWTAILISLAVLSTSKQGWIPLNMWTENASQIGIVMLVLLLSFTLADQINNDRTLRLNAQAVALGHERRARASQHALIQATESANRELEQRVASRTTDLNATLEQLRVANDQLQLLSTTDGLTQIGNRAFFDTTVAVELRRAERQQTPVAVILFDIDHFKRINDTHGHLAGDACLRALADLLRPRINRAGDILARYGGEEFVIALMGATLEQSLALADEFRSAIEALEITFESTPLRMTASFGVVSAVPHPPLTAQEFLAAADRALYEAKGAGRNCVRAATLT